MAEEELAPEEGVSGAEVAPEELEEQQPDVSEPEESEPPSLEDVASTMGWSPQEQWRGDPDKWKPAHQFVRDTAEINSKLSSSVKGLEQRLDVMARTSAKMTEDALAKQRQELLDKRQEAFETGDADTFNKVDEQLNKIPQIPPEQAPPPPETQDFVERNKSWFGVDAEATGWAQNRADELAKQGIGPARQIQIVEREMKNYFPDLMPQEKAKPKPAPLNKPGNRAGGKPAAKSFSTLPPEAQKAALDFEKRGKCSKEEYAASYYQMEAQS